MKQLRWVGSSLRDVRAFPEEVRREAGFQLQAVQSGLQPTDWKAIADIGSGVMEIRIHIGGEWRILYVAKHRSAIYVLHVFQKKSQSISRADLYIARRRYKEVVRLNEQRDEADRKR
ncbi:MAG: type II toxin-antitoxin system RelE/ParE family toxin [Bacteroidota bacterium]|nr:type II toxin-antitoxin system RelE/ParE family toxin [Bacteroidota bacterium]